MPDDLSYELDGYPFGVGTDILVTDFEFGPPDLVTNDRQRPRGDGTAFGRDFRGSRTLTFSINLLNGTGVEARDLHGQLEAVWSADVVRATPGAVSILTMTRAGRTRRVYGRPRRFAPASERTAYGWSDIVADFVTSDDLVYSNVELATTIGIIVPSVGGLIGPLIGPIDAESAGEGAQDIFVGGNKPAWPVFKIVGPIVDPIVDVVGQWSFQLRTTIASDQYVTVDPTPWNRAVRHSNGGNLAGAFTYSSQRLSEMRVVPGHIQFRLRGLDLTNTASAQVFVREAYASY